MINTNHKLKKVAMTLLATISLFGCSTSNNQDDCETDVCVCDTISPTGGKIELTFVQLAYSSTAQKVFASAEYGSTTLQYDYGYCLTLEDISELKNTKKTELKWIEPPGDLQTFAFTNFYEAKDAVYSDAILMPGNLIEDKVYYFAIFGQSLSY